MSTKKYVAVKNPPIKYTQLFINNEFVNAQSGKMFETINPCDGSVITSVHEANSVDVDLAVKAAHEAFKWGSEYRIMDASARGRLLNRLSDLLERDIEYLASLESLDNGKAFQSAVADIEFAVSTLRFYAGAADKVGGQVLPSDGNVFAFTRNEPIGVVAAILPWNYPLMLLAGKFGPAIAAGCTIVLKPAEQTPLTALAFAALVREAGFMPGVFNVVPGYGPTTGQPLVEHALVRKISFTGSTDIGRIIQRMAASDIKRVSLELGGKSALIIMPDADLDHAVQVSSDMVFVNHGQCCIAGSRCFVHESIYDEFVKKSVALAAARKLGDPFDDETQQGPQIDDSQFNKILSLIDSGKTEGAKLEVGGERFGNAGYFIKPAVFSNVTDDMRIAREEIFGPVQSLLKFSTLDEAIERANATNYGLGAGIFTKDINTALVASSRLQAGQVYINNYFQVMGVQVPFGGFKQSGIGREFGMEGIKSYFEVKSVIVDTGVKI